MGLDARRDAQGRPAGEEKDEGRVAADGRESCQVASGFVIGIEYLWSEFLHRFDDPLGGRPSIDRASAHMTTPPA